MRFDKKTIKAMSLADLYRYSALAISAQGTGPNFSKMLDNREENLKKEIMRRAKKSLDS